MSNQSTPSEYIQNLVGQPVIVKLTTGVEYHGLLGCLDGFMNITLESAAEFISGKMSGLQFDDVFIRGNNVYYISKDANGLVA